MEQEFRFISAFFPAVINGTQHKFPVAWEDSTLQRNRITYLPVVFLCDFSSGDRGLAVPDKSLLLVRGDQKLGDQREIAFRFYSRN